jgi:hypothetical protein
VELAAVSRARRAGAGGRAVGACWGRLSGRAVAPRALGWAPPLLALRRPWRHLVVEGVDLGALGRATDAAPTGPVTAAAGRARRAPEPLVPVRPVADRKASVRFPAGRPEGPVRRVVSAPPLPSGGALRGGLRTGMPVPSGDVGVGAVERLPTARAGADSGSSPERGSGPGGGSDPWSTPAGRRVEVVPPSAHRGVGNTEVDHDAAESEDPLSGASPNAGPIGGAAAGGGMEPTATRPRRSETEGAVDPAGGVTGGSPDDAPVGRTPAAEPRAAGRPRSAHWRAAADGVTGGSPYDSPADPAPAARTPRTEPAAVGRPRSAHWRAAADGVTGGSPYDSPADPAPDARIPGMDTTAGGRPRSPTVRADANGEALYAAPPAPAAAEPLVAPRRARGLDELVRRWEGLAPHASPQHGAPHDAAGLTAEDIADALDELVRREAQRHGLDGGTP